MTHQYGSSLISHQPDANPRFYSLIQDFEAFGSDSNLTYDITLGSIFMKQTLA